jgi:hypothetical protein
MDMDNEECFSAGITPAEPMNAQGFDPALSKYSQDQLRVPAGSGPESGRWTSDPGPEGARRGNDNRPRGQTFRLA